MTALANFRHLARGGAPHQEAHQALPDTAAEPGVSITQFFPFQSYFDSTLLEKAILQQSKNAPIVDSRTPAVGAPTPMVVSNVPGYLIGLHPSSQTPVAVQPLAGGQSTSPQPVILKPGQLFRPQGKPLAGVDGTFSGVNWGIPFGWLGGGVATLFIFSSPDADAAWPGNMEIIFHRQRMKVYTPTSSAAPAAAAYNWPLRFPWPRAIRGTDSVSQAGEASIGVEPTKTLMSLRQAALASSVDMRIYAQGDNDLDLDADGNPILTNVRFYDYTWGTYAAPNAALTGAAPNFATQYPLDWMPTPIVRLAADDGGVLLWSDDPAGVLGASSFVDVTRYGKL